MHLIDTHCHLDEEAFAADIDEVIARSSDAELQAIITIGTTADSSRSAVELANSYPQVYAAVGIQPNYAAEAKANDFAVIEELAKDANVVAIGETGLDRYWDYAPIELQVEYFSRHIELSRRCARPFVVHCRDAEADVVRQLEEESRSGPLSGVMHSFCGDMETAEKCLELGLHISFAGMLTYKKNDALRSVARQMPLDRLLVETDAPYLAPTPMRGRRNEPGFVRFTLNCLAELHGIAESEMAEITTRNARRLFGIPEQRSQAEEDGDRNAP